jgi:GT2 family glycosyltransferase
MATPAALVEASAPPAPNPAEDAKAQEYLRRYPDVAAAIKRGRFKSALDHFELHGRFEGRVWPEAMSASPARPEPVETTKERQPPAQALKPPPMQHSFDVIVASSNGMFLEGWIDDRAQPIVKVEVVEISTGQRVVVPLMRCRRQDVENVLHPPKPFEFGFWAALGTASAPKPGTVAVKLTMADGSQYVMQPNSDVRLAPDEFFEHLLAYYGRKGVLGNPVARSFSELDAGFGNLIAGMYAQIASVRKVTMSTKFGIRKRTPVWSLVCCLYGIPDFLYLQIAQFARYMSFEDIEFIFVSNSPELDEVLVRDAEIASIVFGAQIKIISLNQNCGFSYANNVGIRAARSKNIVVINPDVFPRDAEACKALFKPSTMALGLNIVGGKLFYADGSVMHEGMFFVRDKKLSALADRSIWTVEHFRKGFPDIFDTKRRVVPAVSGALMLFNSESFERVGGFDEKFVYGHYEDADLCIRMLNAGGKVLYDPKLAFWHYEGKGSIKRPEHAGSGFVNRWIFSNLWGSYLEESYGGHDAT